MITIDAGDYFLTEPDEKYAGQISLFRKEYLEAGSSMDGCGPLRRCEDPREYIVRCKSYTSVETLPSDWVITTQFMLVRKTDDRLVGMIQVRHYSNDYISRYAGHIGYSVRPSERRRGCAKLMLKAVLPYAREVGLDRVLITCIDDNIGSEKTIRSAGGVYESTVEEPERGRRLKRFWIELDKTE